MALRKIAGMTPGEGDGGRGDRTRTTHRTSFVEFGGGMFKSEIGERTGPDRDEEGRNALGGAAWGDFRVDFGP
jgi:hypothetical protein